MSDALKKIRAARVSLVTGEPFFGALALGLKIQEDTSCETAWVDGRTLGYNPTFIESLTHDMTVALVAHEVMHCAMGHPWRRDARDPKGWNIACDKAINGELRKSFTLPDGALYPDAGGEGKSSEWYYARIQEQESKDDGNNGKGTPHAGNGPGTPTPDPLGEVRDAPTGPDADGDPAPTEQEWKQNTAAAMQQAKMQGKMPGGLARDVSEALKPQLDIRALLLRFFSERANGDYSWSRPNPRYISQGFYLPVLESKDMGEVAIMVDTSGSVDAVSLSYARAIVESVIDECCPSGVTVYYADAKVCRVDRFEKHDPLVWHPAGGGGTNFCPALEAIEAEGNAVCAVCITDLMGRFPEVPPSLPVLWLATNNRIAPFGETVPIGQ